MKKSLLPLTLCMLASLTTGYADSDVTTETQEQNTPAGWTRVKLPSIKAITAENTFSIADYGATTTSTNNAVAINKAILAANQAGGGMVVIPAGTWLSGPIIMRSNVVFHISANATLKLLPFAGVDVVPENGGDQYPISGGTKGKYNYSVFMSGECSNVIVEGEGETSVIDGQGKMWWSHRDEMGTRPGLIRLTKGSAYLFRNFKMLNSPGTNLTLGQSGKASHFTVHDVIIKAPSSEAASPSHNTDGIPVWGPYANIYRCNISTGDDNVVFDSDSQYGHVWNCEFGDGHGASMGSYTTNMHDLLWEDINFVGTGAGFRLKSNSDRSGNVYNITMRNCTMKNVNDPIYITMWYDKHPTPGDATCQSDAVTPSTMSFHDITFQNITSTGTASSTSPKHYFPVFILGRPNTKVYNVTFDSVQVQANKGMFMAYCDSIIFKNHSKITNSASSTSYFATNFQSNILGNYKGQDSEFDGHEEDKNPEDNPGKDEDKTPKCLFSLTNLSTENVVVGFGQDLNLAPYATIEGGTATIHNGHASKDATMLQSGTINVTNSGGSYMKITLDQELSEGDVLTITGGDGGYVGASASSDAVDVISGGSYTLNYQFDKATTLYFCRGNAKPKITSLSITRGGATSIKTIDDDDSVLGIFDLLGNRIQTMREGLNIICLKNGLTKKIIVK